MSRFRNLSPEVQSILVAITGTMAGTIVSQLIPSKKVLKAVIVVVVLAIGIGIWLTLQRYFGGGVNLPVDFFGGNDAGITVTNHDFAL